MCWVWVVLSNVSGYLHRSVQVENKMVKTIEEKTEGHIYTMVCFDMTEIIRNKIKEANNEEN